MTMRRYAVIPLVCLLAMAAPAWALQKGEVAPAFSLTSTDGQVISLSSLSGKVVAISFWATWGKHCEEQMKQLQDLSKEFGEKGLVVLGVNEREDREKVAQFVEGIGATYPILLDEGKTARAYSVNGVPDLWVIDRKGIARDRFIGYGPTLPKMIRDSVTSYLSKSASAVESPQPAAEVSTIPVSLRAYAHLQLGAAHLNIGDTFVKAGYRDGGHFSEALRELRSGVAMDPKNVDLHIWLALALERKNDSAGAVREYETANAFDPANVYAQDALRRLAVPPPAAEEQLPEEQPAE
jgi:peroxiredoxin